MTEFNDTERESKVKQELVKQQLDRLEAEVAQLKVKTQQEFYDELRNGIIEEVAQRFEKVRDGCSPDDIMGRRMMDSAAELVRSMKK
tara:strand:- start:174 stop:434 length:261 start_codon:yes stop_codon:yes gene_type:complete